MRILIAIALVTVKTINLSSTPSADTTQPAKLYKISRQQFLDRYGVDDTARAVINYFFLRRRIAHERIVPSSIVLGVGVFLTAFFAKSLAILGVAFLTVPVMIFSLAFLIRSCTDFTKFSRKKLLQTLEDYFSGKGVAGVLKKRIYHL